MKKMFLLLFIFTGIISCKNETKPAGKENKYPKELSKVFERHGGIDAWRKMSTLSFNKEEEVHTIALHARKSIINTPKYSLGFNGKETWLSQEDSTSFKGNKDFYYNLFFYFYAMPFVLADDGISYEKAEDLTFEGVAYPGYKISYDSDKGTSPDDNYIVYYNPESFRMEWLAYTVTFSTKSVSTTYRLIKYGAWETVNGLVLPKRLTWYSKDEKGIPTEQSRPVVEFTLPLLSETNLPASFFEKPVE